MEAITAALLTTTNALVNRENINVIKRQAPAQTKYIGPGKMHSAPTGHTGMIVPIDSNVMLVSYLSNVVRGAQATRHSLLKNQEDLISYSEILQRELSQYETTDKPIVNYGSHELPRAEAIRRTQLTLKEQ